MINWDKYQEKALSEAHLPIDFRASLSDDELEQLYEAMQDLVEENGFIDFWEDILTKVSDEMTDRGLFKR